MSFSETDDASPSHLYSRRQQNPRARAPTASPPPLTRNTPSVSSDSPTIRPQLPNIPSSYTPLTRTASSPYGSISHRSPLRQDSHTSDASSILGTPRLSRIRSHTSAFFQSFQRPVSTYDHILEEPAQNDTYLNGLRVKYNTFSSIDWLHDSIKDSIRVLKLRRRKSARGRIINTLDRPLGWIVVSIVGFLTAVVAFIIVRLEQWLFDLKDGYCTEGIFKAKRFCCRFYGDDLKPHRPSLPSPGGETCSSWMTWAEKLGPVAKKPTSDISFESWLVEYISYATIALALAFISAMLTVRFTKSTSFYTHKGENDYPSLTSSVMYTHGKSTDGSGTPVQAKRKVMYFAAGSGIPEIKTILGGFVMRGYLGGRVLFVKSVGLALSVASGLSLGKEGPFVHIASCLGNIVSRWFNKYETNEGKRREILSAACAAGVAVAFGAPVGGTLFSLEEVSYFFPAKVMWRSFFCAMIAAMTLKVLDPFGTGKIVLFQVTYDKDWHAHELFFFVLLGLFGGVYGAYFSKLNILWSRHVRQTLFFQRNPIPEVLGVTLLTTILCFMNPYTRMGGTELVYNLFAECQPGEWHQGLCVPKGDSLKPVIQALTMAMLIKAGLTVITFGIKVPAGIFIPTLGVGACIGRIVGLLVERLQWQHPDLRMFESCRIEGDDNCVIPGLYAMVGATAALSGVTRTTISLAVIVFELTGTMSYTVPVMLCILVAKTVADILEPKGIYDSVIELSQLPYLDPKHEYIWGSHSLSELTDRNTEVIRADQTNTVKSLQDMLDRVQMEDTGFPVIDKEHGMYHLLGYIGDAELQSSLAAVAGGNPDAGCYFESDFSHAQDMSSSVTSLLDTSAQRDPYDFTPYMDKAPLIVNDHAPLEVVHQHFTKLGARYIIITNADGYYEGVLDKKMWIGFVNDLQTV